MKIVFLDIDGVLLNLESYSGGQRPDPKCLERLNRITDQTGAKIVVSSSWRYDPNIAKVLKGWGVTASIIGVTPCLAISRTRGEEIFAWLQEHKDGYLGVESFVVIDDDDDMGDLSFAFTV